MENFALIALARSLEQAADGMIVRRVVQHHAGGFLLQTRGTKIPALKLLLRPGSPFLYVSGARPPVENVTTEFLMVLRKYLNGARLTDLQKPLSERIFDLTFKTPLPTKELGTVRLIVELFSNAPNLLLLDTNGRVLASMFPTGRGTDLQEDGLYRYPETGKLDLETALDADRSWFNETSFMSSPDYLIRTVAGVGPLLANEVAYRHAALKRDPIETLGDIIRRSRDPGPTAWVYTRAPLGLIFRENDLTMLGQAVVSPIELTSLDKTHSSQTYPGILEATRVIADALESRALLAKAKAPLIHRLRDQKRRLETRRNRLVERLDRFRTAPTLRATGQLLAASGADMDRRREKIQVTDYFGDTPLEREIALDGSKTLRQNIDRMFQQYRKAERGLGLVEKELEDVAAMERRLASQERHIHSIGDWDAWLARSVSTIERNRESADEAGGKAHPPRRRSVWIDGHEVLVGRNGRENDVLTFRVARSDDFWFHVANYAGAHVIVRNPSRADRLDEAIVSRAAALAAYHSQARNCGKVDVHYTRRVFVTKPRKSKPGQVRLKEFKTIRVEPQNWTPSESSDSRSSDARFSQSTRPES